MSQLLASTVLGAAASVSEVDEDLVTPGVIGFVVTFALMVAVVVLILDMVRRMRRLRYRVEVRERLEAEAAARESGDTTGS